MPRHMFAAQSSKLKVGAHKKKKKCGVQGSNSPLGGFYVPGRTAILLQIVYSYKTPLYSAFTTQREVSFRVLHPVHLGFVIKGGKNWSGCPERETKGLGKVEGGNMKCSYEEHGEGDSRLDGKRKGKLRCERDWGLAGSPPYALSAVGGKQSEPSEASDFILSHFTCHVPLYFQRY